MALRALNKTCDQTLQALIMETLITTARATALIQSCTKALSAIRMPLAEAAGLLLAEDIYAQVNIPAFDQSGIDGYAFKYEEGRMEYLLSGEMAAGQKEKISINPGQAVRVFTGAPIPDGADTAVMQEICSVDKQLVTLQKSAKKGEHVRVEGSEVKMGSLALPKGVVLNPAILGFLAGIGIEDVLVVARPKVSLIITGNELQEPGKPLSFGQVYDSNTTALTTALKIAGFDRVYLKTAGDSMEELQEALAGALSESDLILVTGGVSVGDYDFTGKAFEACGAEKVFHKVLQKPGKPLLFGVKDQKILFGLPGNPASVLTCFFEYVYPAAGLMMGQEWRLPKKRVAISGELHKAAGLTHFMRGYYDGEKASVLMGQDSYRMFAFARANCIIVLEDEATCIYDGDLVEIHLLPWSTAI